VTEYLEQAQGYRDDVVGFLRELIAIPSISGNEKAMAERVVAEMKALGYAEAFIDPMGNAIGRVGDGASKIVLDAHMDTVGVGDRSAWPHDPFEGKSEDGIVFGRGASDNKGAVSAQVYAGRMMAERELDGADVTVYVVGTVMEEDCDGLALEYVLTETLAGVEAVILGECTDLDVYRGHRGRMELVVTTRGESAHASAPERGRNAVTAMAPVVLEVDALNERLAHHEVLGKGSIAVSKIDCDTASLNAIPDRCRVFIDRRLTEGETRTSALEELERVVAERGDVEVLTYSEPSHTGLVRTTEKYYPTWILDEDHPLVTAGVEAGARALGREPRIGRWTFSTNGVASAGRLGIPTIGFGPSEEKWAHSVLDQCPVDHLVKSIAYYAALPAAITSKGESS
jgi:putative selenium metabolism hydrolase